MGIESLVKYGTSGAAQSLRNRIKTNPVDYTERAQNSITNAQRRLQNVGEPLPKPKKGLLGSILDNLQRPGYAVNATIEEFLNRGSSGSTPDTFDPLKAFGRGFTLKDQVSGKNLAQGLGIPDKELFNLFGWKPTASGAVGLLWDIVNPGDPLNWVAPGVGKVATKGARGVQVLAKAYGDDVARIIANNVYKGADDLLEKVAARNVGELTNLVMKHAYKVAKNPKTSLSMKEAKSLKKVIEEGLIKTGNNASTKLPYSIDMPLAVKLANPYTGKIISEGVNIPGTAKVGGAIVSGLRKTANNPVINDILRFFKGNIASSKMSNSKLISKIAPKSVDDVLEDMATNISKVGDGIEVGAPMTYDELINLKNIISDFDVADIDNQLLKNLGFIDNNIEVAENVINRINQETDFQAPFVLSQDELYKWIKETVTEGNKQLLPDKKAFELAAVWKKSAEKVIKDFDYAKDFSNFRGLQNMPPEIARSLRETIESLPKASPTTVDTLESIAQDYAQRITDEINRLPENLKEKAGAEIYQELHQEYLTRMHRIMNNIDKWDKQVENIFAGIDDIDRRVIGDIAGQISNKNPLKEAESLEDLWATIKDNDRAKQALLDFVDWRQEVIEGYTKRGINPKVIEKYVPLIPTRPLKSEEADLVSSLFKDNVLTSHRDLSSNIDLNDMLQTLDPNLIQRTTDINTPKRVNQLLGKEWLEEDAAVMMALRGSRAIRAQETYDFMEGIIQKYGFTMEQAKASQILQKSKDYTFYTIDVTPSGKQIFKQATPALVEDMSTAILLPTEIAETFNTYATILFDDEARGAFIRLFDKASSEFRKMAYLRNPGHIPRDFTGNVFNLWLGGTTSISPYTKSLRLLKDPKAFKITLNGIEYSGEQIINEASQRGILEVGMALAETATDVKNLGKTGAIKKYDNLMRDWTKATDSFTRLSGFLDQLIKGKDFDEAAFHVKKFVFDYFDLTPFERKVMRRLVPFYTWTRKNLPLQVEQLIKQPKKYRDIAWFGDALEGDESGWENKPEYVRDTGALRIPLDGKDIFINPNLPYTDLSRLPVDQKSFNNLLGSLNPLLRVPLVEWPSNTKLFSGREISKYPGETQPIPLAGLLKSLGIDESDIPQINKKYLGYLLEQIPFLRNIDVMTDPDNPRQIARLSSFLGGPSYFSEDSVINSKTYEDLQILTDMLSELKDRGVDVPTISEIEKQRKGKPMSGAERLRQMWEAEGRI